MGQKDNEQKNSGQESMNDNLWDTMFKTIIQELPQMMLPLINEAFNGNYDRNTKITSLNNEFYNVDGNKVASDTALLVNKMLYHFECQFSNDKNMAFRMFEYDFHIALAGAKGKKKINEIVFPKSCVVYITTNKNYPKNLEMKIILPNGEFRYEVPTVRIHDYSLDSISKKNLLIFLPYMALRYSNKLKNKKPPTKEEIKHYYAEMISVLDTAYNDKIIEQWEYNSLLEMIRKAEQRVFHDYPEIVKEVDSMVAELLNLESLKLRDQLKEAERQKEEVVKKAVKEAVEKYGHSITDEEILEILNHAMKQQD